MSFQGTNPKVDFINLKPLSADPSNPQEGDVFYSDGTPRTEGPWVYQNGAWAQFSTGAAITVVNNLTLTPQAADPGSPSAGMLFYSDGTSRAAGLWVYSGTAWVQITGLRYQEFTHKSRFEVRAASTANVTLASQVEAGDSFGGVTLALNDIVLLKNQTTTSENGVYIVQASGAPLRHTSYDSADELTRAHIYVLSGTNSNTIWFQNNTLSTLADAQSWAASPTAFSFTVPEGVHEISAEYIGGGAGGARGFFSGVGNVSGPGGGGGAAAIQQSKKIKVTPGNVLSISLGVGGYSSNSGTSTTISGADDFTLLAPGATTGSTGTAVANGTSGGAAGSTYILTMLDALGPSAGGNGGANGSGGGVAGSAGSNAATINLVQGSTIAGATGGAGGSAAGGASGAGGGGAGASSNYGSGGNGGNGASHATNNAQRGANATAYGAGGGGGGGASYAFPTSSGIGGWGGNGYARLSW